jgi:hypothetical protein
MRIEAPAELLGEDIVAPTPLLKMWHDWGLKCMPYRQPLMSALAAVSSFSAVMGRDYRGPTGSVPPVSFVLLGASCAGKAGPKSLVKHFFSGRVPHELKFLNDIPAGDGWSSDAGVQMEMAESPTRLWVQDEMQDYIKAATATGAASYKSGIMRLMKTWYDGEDFTIPALKGAEKKVIVQPRATVVGFAQPRAFWDNIPPQIIHDGFMNRFLTLPAALMEVESTQNIVRPEDAFPSAIWGWVLESREFLGKSAGKPNFGSGYYRVPFADGALEYARSLDRTYRAAWLELEHAGQSIHAALLGRAYESVLRLATVYAFTESAKEIQVTIPGMAWGSKLVNYCMRNTISAICLADSSGDDAATKRYRRVKHLIQSFPDGISQGLLVNKLHIPKRDFDDVMDQMVRNKLVGVYKTKRGAMVYKWIEGLMQNEVAVEAERIS